eukprot:11079912-Alexandrium_andersonii.AAC.1
MRACSACSSGFIRRHVYSGVVRMDKPAQRVRVTWGRRAPRQEPRQCKPAPGPEGGRKRGGR